MNGCFGHEPLLKAKVLVLCVRVCVCVCIGKERAREIRNARAKFVSQSSPVQSSAALYYIMYSPL